MLNIVGKRSKLVYATAKTLRKAKTELARVARDQYVDPCYFKIVGPVCDSCGKRCPTCAKKRKSH